MKGSGTMDLFCPRDLCTAKVHPQDLFVRAPEIFKMRTSSLNVTLFDENYHKFTSNEIRKKHFPWKVSGSDRCGSVGEISVEKHMETEMQEMVLYPLPETNRELAPAKFMVGVNDIFSFWGNFGLPSGAFALFQFPEEHHRFWNWGFDRPEKKQRKTTLFF